MVIYYFKYTSLSIISFGRKFNEELTKTLGYELFYLKICITVIHTVFASDVYSEITENAFIITSLTS